MFPQALLDTLPRLYRTDGQGYDAVARIKLFHPFSRWTWYLSEYDGNQIFFGLVFGHEVDFGYSSRPEFEIAEVRGLPLERDLSFKPQTFRELIAYHKEINPEGRYPNI